MKGQTCCRVAGSFTQVRVLLLKNNATQVKVKTSLPNIDLKRKCDVDVFFSLLEVSPSKQSKKD